MELNVLLETVHQSVLHRNAVETDPFVDVHEAIGTLYIQVDGLQKKYEALERENVTLGTASNNNPKGGDTAALRNETRLRDKLEKLQEELNEKLKAHQQDTAKALETANALAQVKESQSALDQKLKKAEQENQKKQKNIQHLKQKVEDANATTKLAEKQYMGLKETIRSLQNENDVLKDENRKLIDRLIGDKEKTSNEVNVLNEMIDQLKKEVEMLRTLKLQDDQRRSWFGKAKSTTDISSQQNEGKATEDSRKFGLRGVVVPSSIKHTLDAHTGDVTCVCYDSTGSDLVATCGSDSLVKVWDTSNGTLKAALRGSQHHAITACDIGGGLVVGGGSDKTCRVWNLRTERMIHQLVGHANKITCVRLFGSERAVLTASADRCLKIWDITRKTYRQTVVLRHSSTCYSADVASDSFSTVSGHMDGGLRFWDVRTGERTANLEGLHEGGITSVRFHPSNATQVLTNGKDSCLKVVDLRTGTALCSMRHDNFRTSYNWSTAAFSMDGKYAGAIGGTVGELFIWRVSDGQLCKKLSGHNVGAGGFAWGSGGTCGQQVASADRTGKVILWA